MDPPLFAFRLFPFRPEDLDLRVEVADRLERAVRRIAFVDDDFIGQRQMMPEHLDERVVVLDAVAHRGVDGDSHDSALASEHVVCRRRSDHRKNMPLTTAFEPPVLMIRTRMWPLTVQRQY